MEIPSKQSNLHARCNPDNLLTTLSFTKNLLSLVYISKQIRIIGTKKKEKEKRKKKRKYTRNYASCIQQTSKAICFSARHTL